MNKDILNQIPAEEQPAALKLNSTAETMKVAQTFRLNLETQLMDAYKIKKQPARSWYTKIVLSAGWAALALFGIFALSWIFRALVPNLSPASGATPTRVFSFEDKVRAGNICGGPLAVAHNFSVALTNQDKTAFVALDEQKVIGELRSLAWSPDGKQLAVVGNTTGSGNIYLTDSNGSPLKPVIANSELGYLMDAAWSRDGKQFVAWSVQNNTSVYVVQADGTQFIERRLDMQVLSTPQLAPDNSSIIFYGADSSSAGLFKVRLDGSPLEMVGDLVEDDSSFTWSPDGLQVAYMEMDRTLGEARLTLEAVDGSGKTVIATLPIPKGSGSSIPESANLSWSHDGKVLAFEFGRGATDRAIYLAHTDGSGLIKVADSAHAPAMSADGDCLAYINNKQVFLLDLTSVSLTSTPATPLLLADLPAGRSNSDFRLDKLQWGAGTTPPR